MKKRINWKNVIIILSVAVIVGGGLFAHHTIERRKNEAIEIEERRIQEAYIRVNVAFAMRGMDSGERKRLIEQEKSAFFLWSHINIWPRYIAFHDGTWEGSRVDFRVTTYLPLRFYENRTGIYLPYELVVDYFSQEFEEDGSLRLYNNGNHPEIEAFVDWFWDNLAEFIEFDRRIQDIFSEYRNETNLFVRVIVLDLSPQMIDALARAEADPNYVLDLTSLHEQGY